MDQEGIQSFLIGFSVIAISLALTVIVLFAIFQKRKNKLLRIQQLSESKFKEEIIETQIEIKEETLRNISWELHDNIGQLLTLAKIQLNQVDEHCENVSEASETISQCLKELRSLSKLINPDTFANLTLIDALKLEVERFNRMKYLEASLQFNNETFELDTKVEIIIFRMLQEFFTNTIKHSMANKLDVKVKFNEDQLDISAQDNGIGFEVDNSFKGIGLSNIKNRAKIIGATVLIKSEKGQGAQFFLTYKNSTS